MISKKILKDRAAMLAKARAFFADRDILEVDCPTLSPYAAVDAHIELISAFPSQEKRYLHSSPEYSMKRLLVHGSGDIFQLSHVYRNEEAGSKHNPEFTMAEWYRVGKNFQEMISETADFIRLFIGNFPLICMSYREVFRKFAGIDYVSATLAELIEVLHKHRVQPYPTVIEEGVDAVLNLILGSIIEPQLGQRQLTALMHYPASQAALAKKIQIEDEHVSERFEIYFKGVELANGYHELSDAKEQRQRFLEANSERKKMGKDVLPIDENFLQALEKGLPECCGVAVGFDRLMMLRHDAKHIKEVIPFGWSEA